MKKLFFLGFITLLFACNPKPYVTINGVINNSVDDVIIISNSLHETSDTLTITEKKFNGTIEVKQPGFYQLENGKYGIRIYLKPGSNINLELDINKLKNADYASVVISGKGSDESKLMNDLKSFDISKDLRQILTLPADSFETTIKNNYTDIVNKIDSFKNNDASTPYFYDRIELIHKIEMCEKYMLYTQYHKRLSNDTLPIPEPFYKIGDDIALDNESYYKELKTYKYFVLKTHDAKIQKQLKDENLKKGSVEYTNELIDLIVSLNAWQDVKDKIGNRALASYSYSDDEVKDIYKARYQEMIKDETYIKEFKALLSTLDALKPGNKAPSFSYPDTNGKEISSDNLKGKVIYIDVWATWCGPCKNEIPHLKQLEEELHDLDIAFVSISVDADKEAWLKMVDKKELKGYQLHAKNDWSSEIVKDYAIKSIPRFILIDKEGKLVDANAIRPSHKNTKAELIKLAKS
ncbi:TlpA family protein disulfide reductase [Labilibacter sediminis]|nr:TlpA family protein disulfide reductase [Labilibacter sediminis]